MAIIGDSVSTVQLNLGNRSDLAARISQWLAYAYIDLGMSYPFEELEASIDDMFVPTIGTYDYPDGVRAIKTISMTAFGNSQQPVKRRDIKIIRRYNTDATTGPPSIYGTRAKQILVRPIPNQTFPFTWDVWMLPAVDQTSTSTINASTVLLPLDWIEIMQYMATLRGHISLLERDKAAEIHTLLYGDPLDQTQPGLIKTKLLIHSAESYDSDYAIRPKNRAYSHTGQS
jgi:hypothetical protein